MPDKKYTIVTVVFFFEYDMLLLQARSLHLYASPDLIEKIIVIDNSERRLSPAFQARLRDAYGQFSSRLEIIRARDIARIPRFDGWRTQQILKLMVSRRIPGDRYIVLDAKNHLIFPLTRDAIEAEDGRPKTHLQSYTDNPLRPHLERSLRYFGLDASSYVPSFTSSVTPFVLYTDIVRRLITDVSGREKLPFERAFLQRRLTEFFLYASYIAKEEGPGLAALYDFNQASCPCIWQHMASHSESQRAILQAQQCQSPFFALHRLAAPKFDSVTRRMLAEFWVGKLLFRDSAEAESFLLKIASESEAFSRSLRWRRLAKNMRNVFARLARQASA